MSDDEEAVLRLDGTAMQMLRLLRSTEADEPVRPDPDGMDGHLLAEVALRHYEWSRLLDATHLMLAATLTRLAREQLVET